jgi:hypothetical protein
MKKTALSRLSILILCLYPMVVSMATETLIGKVKGTRGLVSIQRNGKIKPAFPNDKIYISDTIITSSSGAIGILLEDNTLLSMGPIGRLALKALSVPKLSMRLLNQIARMMVILPSPTMAREIRSSPLQTMCPSPEIAALRLWSANTIEKTSRLFCTKNY